MNFWDSVKKDVQKGFREGMAMVREGAVYVREKAEELTEEGKKQYKLFDLKAKVQREITELGGSVYEASKQMKNPLLDSKVKTIMGRIQKLEDQIAGIEGKSRPAAKKTASRGKVAKKTIARKKAAAKSAAKAMEK
jgi:hypothetical protein